MAFNLPEKKLRWPQLSVGCIAKAECRMPSALAWASRVNHYY
jgi:hypothetical protein